MVDTIEFQHTIKVDKYTGESKGFQEHKTGKNQGISHVPAKQPTHVETVVLLSKKNG